MKHLKEVEATYWSHLKFAWGEAMRCEFMCIILFIHGLIPCLFHDSFSKYISESQKRIDKFQNKTPKAWGDASTMRHME
jgi:hypothetical protein